MRIYVHNKQAFHLSHHTRFSNKLIPLKMLFITNDEGSRSSPPVANLATNYNRTPICCPILTTLPLNTFALNNKSTDMELNDAYCDINPSIKVDPLPLETGILSI